MCGEIWVLVVSLKGDIDLNTNNNKLINSLDSSTTNSAVFEQIYRNAVEGTTDNLADTALPLNRKVFRAYRVLTRDRYTNAVKSAEVWHVFVDLFPIDHRIDEVYEQLYPNEPIFALDRPSNDKVYKLSRQFKYKGDYVFVPVKDGAYRQEIDHLSKGFIEQELEPNDLIDLANQSIIRVGEIPMGSRHFIDSPVRSIFEKIGLATNLHWRQDEMPDARYCQAYNCSVCRPLDYLLNTVDDLFLNEIVTLFVGESIRSERTRDVNELKYLESLITDTTLLLETASLSLKTEMMEQETLQKLQRIRSDYQKLLADGEYKKGE
jgi:hypothetical protein